MTRLHTPPDTGLYRQTGADVTVLRQIEVAITSGKTASQACKEAGIHTLGDSLLSDTMGSM